MTKAELIERIARSRNLPPDITKKDVALILGIAFEELASYFAKARVTRTSSPRFTFPRFGTFTKKKRSARRGVNPRTLEPMQIDASCTVDFKASKELRDQMNGSPAKNSAKNSGKTAGKTAGKTSAASRTSASAEAKKKKKKKKKKPATKTTRGKTKTAKTSRRRTSTAAKALAKTTKAKRGAETGKPTVAAPSGRRLTPRDEDAELDALIDDDSLFVELPATRLKRVRPRRNNDAGESGTG